MKIIYKILIISSFVLSSSAIGFMMIDKFSIKQEPILEEQLIGTWKMRYLNNIYVFKDKDTLLINNNEYDYYLDGNWLMYKKKNIN